MPNALLRPCATPSCPELVQHRHCRVHTRARDVRRGTAAARGYTYRWSQYSKAWLRKHPLCGMRQDGQLSAEHSRCVQGGRTTGAQCTDHIRAVAQGGAFWDPSNHQSLCLACNTAKAIALEGGFGR
jgi:5-methylcytosine-specific restriction protein A